MNNTVETDIAIIGGGVAGLWLLNRLRQQGLSAILLESSTLGGGQTNKAQGIIHSGMKYALQGLMTPAAEAIAAMPRLWQLCLEGQGQVDLHNVPVLSYHQYLWTTGAIASKLAGFFAGLALKGNVRLLDRETFPKFFQHPGFKGQVYSLDEIVIDVLALIRELARPNQDAIFKIDPLQEDSFEFDESGNLATLNIHSAPIKSLKLKAQKFVFAAGVGNELILNKLPQSNLAAQRRPLHMVVAKHNFSDPVYAHCLGLGATPRVTITTHKSHDDKTIWYIGGGIAEEGVSRDKEAQIDATRKELTELFPWLDFSTVEFSSFMVDRIEPAQPGGKRPDSCFVKEIGNVFLAWPTKLAFAPLLAQEVIDCLERENMKSQKIDIRELRAWPIPALAIPVWDELL